MKLVGGIVEVLPKIIADLKVVALMAGKIKISGITAKGEVFIFTPNTNRFPCLGVNITANSRIMAMAAAAKMDTEIKPTTGQRGSPRYSVTSSSSKARTA